MTRIEGENTRVRHYLARLKRKSLCYSKSDNENKNQGVTKDYKNNMVFIFKLSVICRIYRYPKTRDDVEIQRVFIDRSLKALTNKLLSRPSVFLINCSTILFFISSLGVFIDRSLTSPTNKLCLRPLDFFSSLSSEEMLRLSIKLLIHYLHYRTIPARISSRKDATPFFLVLCLDTV